MWQACGVLLLCSTLLFAQTVASAETDEVATAAAGALSTARGPANLFVDPPADRIMPASAVLARNTPITGTVATMAAVGGTQPAVKVVTVQTSLLAPKGPQSLSLAMPDGTKVVIRRRNDVPGINSAVASTANANGGPVTSWVGEVIQPRGARGPFSAVAMTVAENGGLYGQIMYWDKTTNKRRSFQISPLTLDGVDPAAAGVQDVGGVSVSSLYPKIDVTRHVVMEIIEPDYAARLAYNHEEREEWLKKSKAALTASAASLTPDTVDTTLPVPQSITANLTAYYAPLQLPEDPKALAESMAASAGPDTPQKSPDAYLAEAQSILASYSTPPTAGILSAPGSSQAASVPVATTDEAVAGRKHRKILQSGNTVIDLLVVYTPNAVSSAGGEANAQNTIRNTINRINMIYTNSRVPITLNLVGMRRVTYTEAADDNGGRSLGDAADGRIPNLHAWRNELGADMVTVWTRSPVGGACGWGYVTDGNAPNLLYSQIQWDCFNAVVVGHELGHNMGCSHNQPGGGGITAYSHGFRRCDLGSNNFITVMSYGCNEVNSNLGWGRQAELFSNPSLTTSNVPAGDANTAHCARTLTETRARVAAARTGVVRPPTGSTITSGLSAGKCLDAPNFNIGTQMTLWDCHGRENQRFELLPDGSLRFPGTNRCLDVRGSGTADGTVVQVWDCNGTPAQLWFYDARRALRPFAAPSKCLDVPGGNSANGVGLQLYECNGTPAQQWNSGTANFFPAPFNPQNQALRSDLNGLCLDVYAFNYNNGGPIVMWSCNNQANQQWTLDSRGLLRSRHNTNKCIDAATVNTGSPVYIWDCHGRGNQQWFRDSRNRLRNVLAPTKCLDIQGANTAAGTRVQLWDCVDVPQQRWQVV